MTATVYIALGSNLDNPGRQLQCAIDGIDSEDGISLLACSRLYRSDPVGPPGQPDYCNAVVSVTTELLPHILFDRLQAIENKQGRVRTIRWGPRTLDLDILLYGEQIIETERLIIPHYQMHLRPFVLYPLNDIAEDLVVPGHGCLSVLLDNMSRDGLDVLAERWPWL